MGEIELEREREQVWGKCGGKCGEVPCIEWNKRRTARQAACHHPKLDEQGICTRCKKNCWTSAAKRDFESKRTPSSN